MEENINESVWTIISILVCAVCLSLLSWVGSIQTQAQQVDQESADNTLMLKEYYEIGVYDNTFVTQPDVVNCIHKAKDKYEVDGTSYIASETGSVTFDKIWYKNSSLNNYTLSTLNSVFPTGSRYKANLIKDADGTVTGVTFRRLN